MINWNYLVILLSALLLAFLLWKELQRTNRANLTRRILATVIAVASLAMMYIPIYFTRSVVVKPPRPVVILTEGFNRDSLNKFLRSNTGQPTIVTFDDRLISARPYNAILVSDMEGHPLLQNSDHPVHVFGYGLSQEEVIQTGKRPVIYHPSANPAGITAVYWNNIVKAGEKVYIQGTFNNPHKKTFKIVLSGFSTALDSTILPAGKNQRFELTMLPKHTGRSLYSLVVLDGKDTLEQQPVPLQVEEAEPLRVLLLASSPGFENNFLRNWLAQKGHLVTTRTLISKNKIATSFLNTAIAPVSSITSLVLNRFDICITDAETLSGITRGELANIQSFVSEKSRGLIIRSDSNTAAAFYGSRFPVSHIPGHDAQINLHLYDTVTILKPLTVETPFFIRSQTGNQSLVIDNQNRVFASSTLFGSGKIVFTTLNNTFNWALAGDDNDYDVFWSELLKKAAGNPPVEEAWSISPAFPRVNEPVTIKLETSQLTIPQANVSGVSVYLTNDPELPFRWNGKFWPAQSGWHPSVQTNGNLFWWYVYDVDDWKTVSYYNRIQETLILAAKNSRVAVGGKESLSKEEVEVHKILFFFLFVISCAFLWVENKTHG